MKQYVIIFETTSSSFGDDMSVRTHKRRNDVGTQFYHFSTFQLLLSYHRRLRMILEALELRVKGGCVSHSWCMCVASHGYGEFGGAGMEMVDGMHAG